MKYFIPLIVLLSVAGVAPAQKFEFGLFGGLSAYSGDLTPLKVSYITENLNPAAGAFLRYYPGQRLAFRLGGVVTQVSGGDRAPEDRPDRRFLQFRSKVSEVSLALEYDLFYLGNQERFWMAPFVTLGAGLFKFNPEGQFDDGQWIRLQPLGTEGQGLPGPNYSAPYGLTAGNILAGGGLKLYFGEFVTVGLELAARRLFTDYLDDVGSTRVNYLDVLEGNGSIAARFSNPTISDLTDETNLNYVRGGRFNDYYFVGGLSLSYRIARTGGRRARSSRSGCPVW